MSLGAAKTALSSNPVIPTPSYGVFITPEELQSVTSNGSYTSPSFTANVTGGVGPFEYSWSSDDLTVTSPTSEVTRIQASGFNQEKFGLLTLNVTDAGNGNAIASASAEINIFFGIQS